MTTLQEFRCEICGRATNSPNHWFVIQYSEVGRIVLKWNAKAANAPGTRHFCGEAHAQIYMPMVAVDMFSAQARLHSMAIGEVVIQTKAARTQAFKRKAAYGSVNGFHMGEGEWTLRPVKAHEEGKGTVQIVCRVQQIPGVAE